MACLFLLMHKHNIIYKTTNTVNNMIYIGQHQSDDLNDGYIGSGTLFRAAIMKYGKDAFKTEVLFDFDTPYELDAKERELVDEDFLKRPDTYNLVLSGKDGYKHGMTCPVDILAKKMQDVIVQYRKLKNSVNPLQKLLIQINELNYDIYFSQNKKRDYLKRKLNRAFDKLPGDIVESRRIAIRRWQLIHYSPCLNKQSVSLKMRYGIEVTTKPKIVDFESDCVNDDVLEQLKDAQSLEEA